MKFSLDALYQSAIRNADGTVNAGYLFLFRMLRVYCGLLFIVTVAAAVVFYSAWPTTVELIKVLDTYATVVGLISAAIFATALPGIAGFIWSDSHNPQLAPGVVPPAGVLPPSTTTTATSTVATSTVATETTKLVVHNAPQPYCPPQ